MGREAIGGRLAARVRHFHIARIRAARSSACCFAFGFAGDAAAGAGQATCSKQGSNALGMKRVRLA